MQCICTRIQCIHPLVKIFECLKQKVFTPILYAYYYVKHSEISLVLLRHHYYDYMG